MGVFLSNYFLDQLPKDQKQLLTGNLRRSCPEIFYQTLRKTPQNHRPKLCGNCAFPKNFHTRKLGEITVFYAVKISL